MKSVLRPYQQIARDRAVAALKNGGGFCLFLDPRCGKTVIALAVVEALRPKALLIVCPKAAIPVWQQHLRRELKLSALGIVASVANYEQVVNHRKVWYDWAREHSSLMIVCDESHFIKRRGTSRSRTVRHLGGFAKYRLALTGTPIAQGIQDAWSQYDFIDPTIFGTWEEFDHQHLIWGGYKKHQITKYRNETEFNRKFHQYSYRVTLREAKKENGSPLKLHYSRQYVDLERTTRRVYDALKNELEVEVNRSKVKVRNVLACVMKLQQITGGFLIAQVEPTAAFLPVPVGKEKLEKLHEVIRSLRARSKFIVVARFLHEIEAIRAFLVRLHFKVQVVRGGEPYDGKFDSDVIVMQIQSGIAVDMSQADSILFYSSDYSYINLEQARFRILSYDKPSAHYTFLLARDTIDELIYEAVVRKKNLARLVIDTFRGQHRAVA